jgi:hypothetical protein
MTTKVSNFFKVLGIILMVFGVVTSIVPVLIAIPVAFADGDIAIVYEFIVNITNIHKNLIGIITETAGVIFFLIGTISTYTK